MTQEKRIASAEFDSKLVKLLTECKNDDEMYERLCWALQRITLELSRFTNS